MVINFVVIKQRQRISSNKIILYYKIFENAVSSQFIYIFAYLIEGVMSRIIAIANFFPYLTLAPVSINH